MLIHADVTRDLFHLLGEHALNGDRMFSQVELTREDCQQLSIYTGRVLEYGGNGDTPTVLFGIPVAWV